MDSSHVATITAIAALLTGLATFFSLRELRIQRRVQSRPELALEDVQFRVLCTDPDGASPAITLSLDNMPVSDSESWPGDLQLRIQNVGRGVARDVSASWSFDAYEFATLLAPYEDSIGGRIWVNGKSVQLEGRSDASWLTTGNSHSRMGAILPVPVGQGKTIAMDFAYTRMLTSFFFASSFPANIELLREWELPDLQLHLSYLDIEGKRYEKSLRLRFQRVIHVRTGFQELNDDTFEVARGNLLVDDA